MRGWPAQETDLAASLLRLGAFLVVGAAVALSPVTARAAALDYPVEPGGYVFGQTFDADGSTVLGYAVTDEEGISFWSSYEALGGRASLGPALSGRYLCGPSVCQAFERGLLRWDPAAQEARPVDVLSDLHRAGQDAGLQQTMGVPAPWDWSARDAGRDPAISAADHRGLYGATAELAVLADALGSRTEVVIGTPEAVELVNGLMVLRGTRGAVVDSSPDGAGAGAAYVLGAGRIAREMGLIPAEALAARVMAPSAALPPSRLAIPRLGMDVPLIVLDPSPDGSLPAPDEPEQVAWYSDTARLGEGGNLLLAGHVDWIGRQAAFRRLDVLVPGDEVWLSDDAGRQVRYAVAETGRYAVSSPLLQQSMVTSGRGAPTLTLVTCGGVFDVSRRVYLERTLVRGVPSD